MFKAVTKCLVCYFRVQKRLGALMEAWKYFHPRVGFGLLTRLHVFDFWECVLRNLETRVAPLRAYRKTIQFRLKFRLIRSPKTPQNPFQPDTLVSIPTWLRLDFWRNLKFALGNQALGRNWQSARADLKIAGWLPRVILSTLGSFFCCFIRDFAASLQTRFSLSLSSFTSSSPLLHSQTLENLHLSHLNLPI